MLNSDDWIKFLSYFPDRKRVDNVNWQYYIQWSFPFTPFTQLKDTLCTVRKWLYLKTAFCWRYFTMSLQAITQNWSFYTNTNFKDSPSRSVRAISGTLKQKISFVSFIWTTRWVFSNKILLPTSVLYQAKEIFLPPSSTFQESTVLLQCRRLMMLNAFGNKMFVRLTISTILTTSKLTDTKT